MAMPRGDGLDTTAGANYELESANNYVTYASTITEAVNSFTVELWVNTPYTHQIDLESNTGYGGETGQNFILFPVYGGDPETGKAGMGISVGTNGVSVYEHADGYMPALLVWEYPIDTVWTHVAVVYHNGKPSLYINGVWKKDGLQSLKQHVYPGTMFPGGYYGSQGDGILDEVRIWSVARTQAQIAANKDGELTGPQTGLVGYWPMNEGTGLVLHDVSGSGRDVDLTSAGYTSASWTNGRYSVASVIGSYRYAFNGKEKDGDIGEYDYDFGARIYDARLGRWLSIDPLTKKYPSLSPYAFVNNDPVLNIDYDGRDFGVYINEKEKTITIKVQYYTDNTKQIYESQLAAANYINSFSEKYKFVNKNGDQYKIKFDVTVAPLVETKDKAANEKVFTDNMSKAKSDNEANFAYTVGTGVSYTEFAGQTIKGGDAMRFVDYQNDNKILSHPNIKKIPEIKTLTDLYNYVSTHEDLHSLGVDHALIGLFGKTIDINVIKTILAYADKYKTTKQNAIEVKNVNKKWLLTITKETAKNVGGYGTTKEHQPKANITSSDNSKGAKLKGEVVENK